MQAPESKPPLDRRQWLALLASAGLGTVVFQRAVASAAERGPITATMIEQAEWIAGLELSPEQRDSLVARIERAQGHIEVLREIELDYDVPPALLFDPEPGHPPDCEPFDRKVQTISQAPVELPLEEDELAFLPVSQLAGLLREKKVSSVELTKLYLRRLQKFDPVLYCVVSLTEELALRQAAAADKEIAAGRYRGPLHGIPWGAKDLISYPGYKTTWGAAPFQEQRLQTKATVAQRLDDAGAVLAAKLSMGALAWGDRWFGGMTRNPWFPDQGSNGSSAGSASATVAGLVGFSLGSETLGSIVSPSKRCGASGLRPTFGRVSRYGCMSLSWSMDKLGPICRSIEDCALVFAAIAGRDGRDGTVVDRPFAWPPERKVSTLTVGYQPSDTAPEDRPELQVLRDLGVKLKPIELPGPYPAWASSLILNVEAATVFDPLTRQKSEDIGLWPNVLRQGQMVPAVEYLRANRVRTLLMQQMKELMKGVDAYIDLDGDDLAITNLTGHPSAVLPNGFIGQGDAVLPQSIVFTGQLYGESDLLALAHAYQKATGFHLRHPSLKTAQETPPAP
ncbi:amidase [Lignipirellula cremea]|uniref:Glutamyl-tRNA(Gln) amidotransferase subunit A n=1 Tax=Lignipirellula cremea TaxID=2528010 RepID=A0A518DTR1_9BACT|nr:amidase [Lignipirellula cremea]QDU95223.1 Glutamyl-tRNA(Gln) amidotransferase subunit A [Lignipirellula cremea]